MATPQQDYYAWTQETVEKLRQGRFEEVKVEDLIENSRRWAEVSATR